MVDNRNTQESDMNSYIFSYYIIKMNRIKAQWNISEFVNVLHAPRNKYIFN